MIDLYFSSDRAMPIRHRLVILMRRQWNEDFVDEFDVESHSLYDDLAGGETGRFHYDVWEWMFEALDPPTR